MASLRKLKGKWYVRIRYNGKEKLIPTYTSLRRDAEITLRKYQQNEQEVKLNLAQHLLDSQITIKDCAKYFERNYKTEKGITQSTMDSYSLAIKDFQICFSGFKSINDLNNRHFPILVDYLQARYNETTVNIRLRGIRVFLNYLLEKDFIKSLPLKVKQIKTDKRSPKMLLPEELDKIYSLVEDEYLLSSFKVLEVTGMRVGELRNSHREGEFIVVEKSKSRKNRYIPIPPDYIRDYDKAKEANYTPGWISHSFSEFAKMAGITGKTAHSLRHTFAYRMLLETNNIQIVRDLLGHSSTVVTEIYTQMPTTYLKQVFKDRHINRLNSCANA